MVEHRATGEVDDEPGKSFNVEVSGLFGPMSAIIQPPTVRKCIHIDMDAFFASVEQRDHPEFRGKPLIVGGSRERGVVAAASYEARKFGIHSAMPSITAMKRCPDLIVAKPRFDVYREVSMQIREIFRDYTDLVEPLSLDEAYLDVTINKKNMPIATQIAEEIRARIFETTQLTASAGVSYSKFLAKMASDQNKPNGIFVIKPKDGPQFMETLPIRKFHGIGPAGAEKMARLGIQNGADLKTKSLEFLKANFGKSAQYFYDLARGIDERVVNPNRERKSLGKETTFADDLNDLESLQSAVTALADQVWDTAAARDIHGRTLVLKVKYADFEQITRSKSVPGGIVSKSQFSEIAEAQLKALFPLEKAIRLVGVTLSGLDDEETPPKPTPQLELDL
jgi:DNA polymerase-4